MKEKGIITILALIFGAIFLIYIGGTVALVITRLKAEEKKEGLELAFQIAEAGIQYAKWRLLKYPEDYNFSGEYEFKNFQGEVVGKFKLQITPPSNCHSYVILNSEGWSLKFPKLKRKIQAKFGRKSLADFALLTNSNLWIGINEEVKGPFHSNGGIRMDGEQNSLATSARETYLCTQEQGCNPPQEKPGIWGEGSGKDAGLWKFPVPPVDFGKITQDLAKLKELSLKGGFYFPNSNQKGYHFIFKANGTFEVFLVTQLKEPVWGYNGKEWVLESNSIKSENFLGTYQLKEGCNFIFVEDTAWVEGDVLGRVTLAVGKLPENQQELKKIIINGNINYVDENSVLGLIAQKDILIPLYAPNNLEIKASLIAQKGRVFRYYYPAWDSEPYKTYSKRSYIETLGSIVSFEPWTFTWVNDKGEIISGYLKTEINYDQRLNFDPPPGFPVEGNPQIFNWEEL